MGCGVWSQGDDPRAHDFWPATEPVIHPLLPPSLSLSLSQLFSAQLSELRDISTYDVMVMSVSVENAQTRTLCGAVQMLPWR